MKKFILVIFLCAGILNFAQKEVNRFEESEVASNEFLKSTLDEPVVPGPGNVAIPTPIDDYLPILIMIAIGIIYYKFYRRNPTL